MNVPAQIKSKPLRQVANVQELLVNDMARDQLAAVAARHMNPERLMRVMANSVRVTPALAKCEPLSLLGGLMQCAALGLEPNTVLGHAYLIPFENSRKTPDGQWVKVPEVQLVVGYKGLIDLARRSGHITSIAANIHYSDDELWEYEEGTEATLRHRPGAQEGTKLHAYAIAKFKDGGHAYVVLPWKHVIKVRDGSQGWQMAVRSGKTAKNPWHAHEDAMAMKTAVRALAKYLPLSVEFTDAVQIDERPADFRRFAMAPEAGLTIEGEPVDEDEPAAQAEVAAPAQKAEAQPRKSTRHEAQKAFTEAAAPADADQRPQRQRPEGPSPEALHFQSVYDRICGDMLDGASASQLMEVFAAEIDAMRVAAPGLHKQLMQEMVDHDAMTPGDEGQA